MITTKSSALRFPKVVIDRTSTDDTGVRTLRCAVVGVGRMGRHHARKYAQMAGSKLVAVVDRDAERRKSLADEFDCHALSDERELLDLDLDAVSIAVPTQDHLRCATPLIEAGVACLIEKPLANTEIGRAHV